MNKIENYLGIANHDIQMANNSQELKSYVASILCENDKLQQENQELKKQLHEASLTIQEMTEQDIECPSNCEKLRQLKKQLENYKKLGFKYLQDKNNNLEKQQKEFIKYLEDEKDRLARECSNIYEDSLGHTRLVNEDKFNEVNDILQKYKSVIGVSDDKTN